MNKFFGSFCMSMLLIASVQPVHAIRTKAHIHMHGESLQACTSPHAQGLRSYSPVYYEEEVEKPDLFWNSFRKVAGGVLGFCFGCWTVHAVSKVFC